MAADLFGENVPRRRALGSHESAVGGSDEWLTPRWLIDQLGPFDLDPCSPINRPWPTAARHYTIENDGLRQDWDGFVWCNPPYSQIDRWLARMADHNHGLALVAARTETRAWHEHIWPRYTGGLSLRGRLHFCDVTGKPSLSNSGFPSVVVAFGDLALQRLRQRHRAAPNLGSIFLPDHGTRDVLAGGVQDAKSALGEAIEWLKAYLLERGGVALAGEAIDAARADGIAERTVQRARTRCGATTSRGTDGWVWALSQDGARDPWHLGMFPDGERGGE
jgi:hypothetical protein